MIRQQAIKGIRWTAVTAIAGNVLQFIQLAVVSLFITASDYGLMSLTLVVVYFAQLLGDMGISNALIYKQQISRIAFSSLFWASLLFCWLIFGVLFFISPLLASFFKEPALEEVVRVTAVLFTFLPLQMQYLALLRKELQFDKIAIADIFSKGVALIVAVVLARKGQGVFALVYSTLTGVAVSTLLYWYWGSRQMTIGFVFKRSAVREFLHFGIYQTGNDVLNYFNLHIDTLLLGKLLGIDAVGYYSFAKNLAIKPVQVINPVITQVAFPLMAKVNDNIKAVKSIYLKVLGILSSVNFLVYPFLAASSVTILRVFFTSRWLPAAPALQGLALYYMIRSVFNPVGVLLGARGMVKRLFYWNILLLCVIPVVVFFAAAAGIAWVAAGLSAVLLLFLIPMWKYLVLPASGAGFGEFCDCLKIPLINALVVYIVLVLFNQLPVYNPTLKLAGSVAVWLAAGFVLTRFVNKQVYKEVIELAMRKPGSEGKLSGL